MRHFIGDIHGQADKLIALLTLLGYQERHGAWRHPTHVAEFVGDFIDRGPGQLRTLKIVRAMIDAGAAEAVMGNHEFNGIAFHTPDPLSAMHLRQRTEKNRHQHVAFLDEVGEDSRAHREWIHWFMTLPLWLETPDYRMVHACWHADHMATLTPLLGPNQTLTPSLLEAASRKGSAAYESLETILKGPEIELPPGVAFTDTDGTTRRRTRVKWWDEKAITYRQAALLSDRIRLQLPDISIPEGARVSYDHQKPVFFGHYWFTGTPSVLSSQMCCVDYSAARAEHPLVAYRWEGEPRLTADNLVAVGGLLQPDLPLARHLRR